MFSLKVQINELYFTDRKSRQNLALKNNLVANSHSKQDSLGFIYVSIYAMDFLRVSSTSYELEGFELLFYLNINPKQALCIFLRYEYYISGNWIHMDLESKIRFPAPSRNRNHLYCQVEHKG